MALYSLSLITLLSIAFAAYHLLRVPNGPACPRCGTLTEPVGASVGDSGFLSRFRTEEANCPSCGWSGRMRRAPRPEVVRASERGRRS
jgi:hypothetical protein